MTEHPIEIAFWIMALARGDVIGVELAQLLDDALRVWPPRATA
jgi:hypothetical protein